MSPKLYHTVVVQQYKSIQKELGIPWDPAIAKMSTACVEENLRYWRRRLDEVRAEAAIDFRSEFDQRCGGGKRRMLKPETRS